MKKYVAHLSVETTEIFSQKMKDKNKSSVQKCLNKKPKPAEAL